MQGAGGDLGRGTRPFQGWGSQRKSPLGAGFLGRAPGLREAAVDARPHPQLYLRELLRLTHPRFYQHLVSLGEDGLQMLFCHRWLLLCFKREFPEAEALRIWEACWAHYQVSRGDLRGRTPATCQPSRVTASSSHVAW